MLTATPFDEMRHRRPTPRLLQAVTLLCCALLLASPRASAGDFQLLGDVVTDRTNRGLDRSDDKPSVGVQASWYPASGWFATASASTVKLAHSVPTGAQFIVNGGYQWRLESDWSLSLMLSHYQFSRTSEAEHFEYDELGLTGGWRDCLFVTVTGSPNAAADSISPRTRAYSYNLIGHLPLGGRLSAVAGLGYYDLHAGLDTGYTYGDIGLSYQFHSMQFQVSYVGTRAPERAKQVLGPILVHRWVAQMSWYF